MLLTRLFVLVILYQNVLGKKHICNLEDTDCLTQGAKRTYTECVNGNLRGVSSSDPLFIDLIEVDTPTIKFTVENATFSGMKSCSPELVRINPKDMRFDYHIACKLLIVEGDYKVKGELGSMPIEGKGVFKNNHYDYILLFNGEVMQEFDKDENLHVIVKNYKLDTKVRGKVVYDYKNLYNGDSEKSAAIHKYANENSKEMDKVIGLPVIEKFMKLFMKNVNAYMKTVPVEHVFMYED